MTPSDVDHALRVLNIEPLYGHSPAHPPRFRKAHSHASVPPVYFVEDEELDFDRVLKEEKIFLPKGVSWTAHWLAVEGVQPLIPENPPSVPTTESDPDQQTQNAPTQNGVPGSPARAQFPPTPPSPSRPAPSTVKKQAAKHPLVKHVLSRELQLYYNRLTGSLIPPPADHAKRSAALASLRIDAGLQSLLPYLVRWVAEGVVNSLKAGLDTESEGRTLEVWLEVLGAILENSNFFIEPYLHQILPPLLSILLTATLPPAHATHLRTLAAQTLSRLLTAHSTTYPSLSPRLMKTLLLALISPGKSMGTREGAVRGLMGVGKEATRKGLVESGGVRVIGDELETESGTESIVGAVFVRGFLLYCFPFTLDKDDLQDALIFLRSPSPAPPVPLEHDSDTEKATVDRLRETFGDYFARRIMNDGDWAKAILSGPGG